MKRWLAFLMVALPVMAQAPEEFRWEAPVTVTSSDALNRLTLPFEVYRDARPDFADLRLFNAQGEALPIAFARAPEAARTDPMPAALPIFPVSGEPGRESPTGALDVMVKSDASGTIVSVQGRTAGKPAPARTASWLIDASKYDSPMRALVLDWNVHAGTEVVKVDVEASEDLKSWRRAASRAPLMHLQQGESVLEQRRVDLHGLRAKYLRVTGEPAAFALSGVKVLSDEVVTRAPRPMRMVVGTPGSKPGEYVFDLGARLPVEAVRIVLPTNTVAPFGFAARDDERQPWRPFISGTFYNLVRDGVTLESPAAEVYPTSTRYMLAQLDTRSPPLSAAPKLEVQYRPAQLVFVARGEGPYQLEFGHREAKRTILAVNQLIPGYGAHAELKLPEAGVGDVKANAPPESALRAAIGDTSPRKVALWAILVVAVLVLAGMAWRLSRQMKDTASKPSE